MSPRESYSAHCRTHDCSYARLLLPTRADAQEKAQEHAGREGHRVEVRRTVEQVVTAFDCACAEAKA